MGLPRLYSPSTEYPEPGALRKRTYMASTYPSWHWSRMACSAASDVSATGCALSSSVMSRNEADMKPTEPSYSMQYQGALERSVTVTYAPLGRQSTMRNSVPGPSRILTSLPVTTAVSAQAEACESTANKNANRSVLKNFLSMPNRSFICITLSKTSSQSAGTGLPAPRLKLRYLEASALSSQTAATSIAL